MADFVGKANFLKGILTSSGDFHAEGDLIISFDAKGEKDKKEHTLMVRPERINVVASDENWHVRGEVKQRFYLGNIKRYKVQLENGDRILLETFLNLPLEEHVYLQFSKYRLIYG